VSGIAFIRVLMMPFFVIVGIHYADVLKKRGVPAWLTWSGWLIVTLFFWFAFGYVGGVYA